MDVAHLAQVFALTGIAVAIGWFVLTSLGRAGDAVSGAFSAVGPDAHAPATPTSGSWWLTARRLEVDPVTPFVEIDPAAGMDPPTAPRTGRFVVPPIRVAPIRLRVLAA